MKRRKKKGIVYLLLVLGVLAISVIGACLLRDFLVKNPQFLVLGGAYIIALAIFIFWMYSLWMKSLGDDEDEDDGGGKGNDDDGPPRIPPGGGGTQRRIGMAPKPILLRA